MEILRSEPDKIMQLPLLRDVLVETTFNRGRVLNSGVIAFELGLFNQESLDLIGLSRNHPGQHEFHKTVLVTNERKVRVSVNATEGNEYHVQPPAYRVRFFSLDQSLPKEQRQDVFYGFPMHTHPDETDPSFEDISELLVGDFDPSASTGVFVVNYLRRVIMFRGERTPQISRQEASQEVDKWKKDVESKAFNAVLTRQLNGNIRSDVIAYLNLQSDLKTQEIIQQYDLRCFDSPLEESVAKLRVY